MDRYILDDEHIHPEAKRKIAANHRTVLEGAMTAIETHEWVILGMDQNPVVKKARKMLADGGKRYQYIGYGNYLREWRKRNVFKMWTGWPTFPMVFHKGVLIGGAHELEQYLRQNG